MTTVVFLALLIILILRAWRAAYDLERDQEKWTPVFRSIPLQYSGIDHVLST